MNLLGKEERQHCEKHGLIRGDRTNKTKNNDRNENTNQVAEEMRE